MIDTNDASSIQLPTYSLPHMSQEHLWKKVMALPQLGIITPSKSLWAAPIVLVTKKDGSKSLCMDFWNQNLVTRADPYPILRIEDLIDSIGIAKFIMAFDLTIGYWQVPVAKKSQENTVFLTFGGNMCFSPCPLAWLPHPLCFRDWLNKYSIVLTRLRQ